MNSLDLLYFREVAESGGLREASKRLDVAPSAISRRIKRLEASLKVRLFERDHRGMTLTEAGMRCLVYAQEVTRCEQRLCAELQAVRQLDAGKVGIYFTEGQLELVAQAIVSFRERHPGITFDVKCGSTRAIAKAVENDETDIGIAFAPNLGPSLDSVIQMRAPLVAVITAAHALAGRERVSLAELSSFPLALPEPGFGIRRILDRVARDMGINLNIAITTDSIATMKAFVRHHGGVTILSYMSITPELRANTLATVPLMEDALRSTSIEVFVRGRRQLSPAVSTFLRHLQAQTTPGLLSRWMLPSKFFDRPLMRSG